MVEMTPLPPQEEPSRLSNWLVALIGFPFVAIPVLILVSWLGWTGSDRIDLRWAGGLPVIAFGLFVWRNASKGLQRPVQVRKGWEEKHIASVTSGRFIGKMFVALGWLLSVAGIVVFLVRGY